MKLIFQVTAIVDDSMIDIAEEWCKSQGYDYSEQDEAQMVADWIIADHPHAYLDVETEIVEYENEDS